MKASRPTPISCHTGPTLCSTCSIENVSCPAGTGVWVVNVLAARTLRTASANGVPRVTNSRTRSTSMNAACPSFACQAAGSYPRVRKHSHAPDAQDPLLPQPQVRPAGVEPMGQPAVGRVVLCEIRVQEEDRHPTHHDPPSADAHGAAGESHCCEAGISLGPPHRLE